MVRLGGQEICESFRKNELNNMNRDGLYKKEEAEHISKETYSSKRSRPHIKKLGNECAFKGFY